MTAGQVLSAIKVDVVRQPIQAVPNVLDLLKSRPRSSVRVCLFGKPKPDETKKVYDDFLVSNRQYAINRYGFDVATEKFIENNSINNNTNGICTDTSSSDKEAIIAARSIDSDAVHQRLHGDKIINNKNDKSEQLFVLTDNDSGNHLNDTANDNLCDVNNRLSDAISEKAEKLQNSECNNSEIIIKAVAAAVATSNIYGKSKHDLKPYAKPSNKSIQITGILKNKLLSTIT